MPVLKARALIDSSRATFAKAANGFEEGIEVELIDIFGEPSDPNCGQGSKLNVEGHTLTFLVL